MKKKLMLVALSSLVILAAGCGTKAGQDKSTSEPVKTEKPSDKKIEMVWAGWTGEEKAFKPVIDSIIEDWNKKEPNATVKWLGWPWDQTQQQLILRGMSKDQIDVAQVDIRWVNSLAEAGLLEDLGTLFDKNWISNNFDANFLKIGQVEGKQVGLPWTLGALGMLYNPTLLEKAGVKDVPTTVTDFEDALKKVKAFDKNIVPYAISTKVASSVSTNFQAWLWQNGGNVFDKDGKVIINNETGVKTLTWFKSLYDNGLIKMDLAQTDARVLHSKGQSAFYDDLVLAKGVMKSNGIADQDLDKIIRPMARPLIKAGDQPQSKIGGTVLVVFKDSKYKQKAADYIKHVVGEPEALKFFKESGNLPTFNSAIKNELIQKDAYTKKFLELTTFSKRAETEPFASAKELDNIITEEFQAGVMGAKTPQKALDDAATKIKSTLKK
ncbi:ABC transporter substrate-binding protein [Paenibacillus roseipurpureus]|uniref:Sugar ABC transporter substrate-binding protein n=1 Tax=Paenibacillus roseopurpureus TaxID=2918901 RepID=A0AA96LRS6_9BACL|nr:sugar ABC transporter substrate-binding protein [Paenibacillus sp. MBLB1832]WNR46036.1 sugar ABC transporter substrate-binding protein [Paenibacillus sp. MBLB1832]